MSDVDLIIIGAGPAGMAAASTAAQGGAHVLVLEEQQQAGGQIYRNLGANSDSKPWLGKEYAAGSPLLSALSHKGIKVQFGATVWRIDSGHRVFWSSNDSSHISTSPFVLLATGAQERPVPFPGWTLPGVMTAGAAQILMKSSGLIPRDAVLAGSGPLIFLVAAQMIAAGLPPKAIVETQTLAMAMNGMRHFHKAAFAAKTLLKGLGLLRKIRKAGVQRYTSASAFHAATSESGDITFSFCSKGIDHKIDCALLLTHQGIVPSTHITRAAGINHAWNDTQVSFQPKADSWGRAENSKLYVAGDGAGIGGADVAAAAGRLAALDILHRSDRLSKDARNQLAKPAWKARKHALAIRPFLDATYAPPNEFTSPADETIVCRCEEVTAAEIRHAAIEGAAGHRQIKTATRAGMGPCQGRMCDLTVHGILSNCTPCPTSAIAPPRARTPIKPITLGELAALDTDQETQD